MIDVVMVRPFRSADSCFFLPTFQAGSTLFLVRGRSVMGLRRAKMALAHVR
jgi:hypothetical protein